MTSSAASREQAAWLRLSLDAPRATALVLLHHLGPPEQIFASPQRQLAAYVAPDLAQHLAAAPSREIAGQIEHALHWASLPGHTLVPLGSDSYPPQLLAIGNAPLLLYVDGDVQRLSRPGVAIVGARQATVPGRENARTFAATLARHGLCVISGLAVGIDAAAHEGALDAGATGAGTIAVTGTGLDLIYPRRHAVLAERIRQQGALVSELPLNMPARPHHFPMRNRVVAGLAQGVLIVEAAAQSGSLITARLACESGREVFALPGSIHAPLSRGCHALIRQGATLTETVDDILAELPAFAHRGKAASDGSRPGAAPAQTEPVASSASEDKVAYSTRNDLGGVDAAHTLLQAMGHDPVSLDALAAHTAMRIETLASALVALDLAGAVRRLADGRYQCVQR